MWQIAGNVLLVLGNVILAVLIFIGLVFIGDALNSDALLTINPTQTNRDLFRAFIPMNLSIGLILVVAGICPLICIWASRMWRTVLLILVGFCLIGDSFRSGRFVTNYSNADSREIGRIELSLGLIVVVLGVVCPLLWTYAWRAWRMWRVARLNEVGDDGSR